MATKSCSRTLEVTIISGEGLLVTQSRPVKKNAFVIVRTDSVDTQMTKLDTEGESNPAWNEKLVVDMPIHARFLTVEVQCKTSSGNRVIGTARVPVSDFTGGYTPENYLHFLSYRLRDGNGERNGIINLSVRAKVPENASSYATFYSQPGLKVSADEGVSGGIVTGVPVWYGYQR
ncbi:BON1-associated protein 1-like [Cornus florida]|uniref:BON1-associated protein 1-like n=1 Tax=Cornus florida TaxID=4283 RepID=UPI0028A2B1BF|nr:BON1-associated protein 1-like [Cornus florida]